jgi:hypothetical protein
MLNADILFSVLINCSMQDFGRDGEIERERERKGKGEIGRVEGIRKCSSSSGW